MLLHSLQIRVIVLSKASQSVAVFEVVVDLLHLALPQALDFDLPGTVGV